MPKGENEGAAGGERGEDRLLSLLPDAGGPPNRPNQESRDAGDGEEYDAIAKAWLG